MTETDRGVKEDSTPKDGHPAGLDGLPEDTAEWLTLGSRLRALFSEWSDARADVEEGWLKDLRQFRGVYDPDVAARMLDQGGARSDVFIKLTRTKVISAYSRIVDLLFGGDRFFGIEATPEPTLEPAKMAELKQQALVEIMSIGQGQLSPEDAAALIMERRGELQELLRKESREIADSAAAAMQRQVEDQLVELNAEHALKDTVMEMCMLGSGAIKCGTMQIRRQRRFVKRGPNDYRIDFMEEPYPEVDSVSVFDCFPDPLATSNNDMGGFFRRHRLTKRALRKLARLPGFDSDGAEELIAANRSGNYREEQYERERRELGGTKSEPYASAQNARYEVLEYWGTIDGQDLVDHMVIGADKIDVEAEYEANVWLCETKVLMVRLNPVADQTIPYKIAPYERIPGSIWGEGVPRMMRDSQKVMNAAARIFLDNAAIAAGPMAEVNVDMLAPGEDPRDIRPWRVFVREGGDPMAPAVRFFQAASNTDPAMKVLETFRRFADETTSLPSYTHGEQGKSMNRTATGMSMLMGAANTALKATIKNVDDYLLAPLIESLFAWNMRWNPREDIKGDLRVVARGSTALVQKEVQSQRLLQFLSILMQHPTTAAMAQLRHLLGEIAQSMEIDPEKSLVSEEESKGLVQQLQQAAGGPGPTPPGVDGQQPTAVAGANGGFSPPAPVSGAPT